MSGIGRLAERELRATDHVGVIGHRLGEEDFGLVQVMLMFGLCFGAAQGRPGPGKPTVEGGLAQLAPLGAVYEVCGDRILASNCIFHEACREGVACDVQAGLLEGVLNTSGLRAGVLPLGPEGAGCSDRLEVR